MTRGEVADYLACLKGRGGQPAAPETVNRHRATLHALYEWLIRDEELEVNPVARVERKKVGSRLPRPMTRKQIQTFFSRLSGLREQAPRRRPVVVVVVFGSLLALIYIVRVIEAAYFQPSPDDAGDIREAPLALLAPLMVLALACLYFGIDTDLTVGVAKIAALSLLGGYQ